jgi:hypothetical protein
VPPFLLAHLRFGGRVGDRVGSDTADQVMTLFKQAFDDLACGVVGVGDKVEQSANAHDPEQAKHSVEQGSFVAIGPYHALMDTRGKRNGEHALRRVHEYADGLQGMPHNVFGLGVGFRFLMQQLDPRHLLAALGDLDAVPHHDEPTVDTHGAWEQLQHCCRP